MIDPTIIPIVALAGFVGGIVLFGRGLVAYRRDRQITAVATSSLDSLAAGEVRVSGVVAALDHILTSPLQSRPCVWYRARIETTDDSERVLLDEEAAVHFQLKDHDGSIRVVPAGARWEIGPAFDETGGAGDEPPSLARRQGAAYAQALPDDPAEMTEEQRQAAIDALLTVSPGASSAPGSAAVPSRRGPGLGSPSFLSASLESSGRRYCEARLEIGQAITVLGQALPWADVREELLAPGGDEAERAISEDIAAARAAGWLAATPTEAWGNAAIPGFGIGRPTRAPELDPGARPPEVQGAQDDKVAMERYEIPAHELVLAGTPEHRLAIYAGTPEIAIQRHDQAFLLGLAGGVMVVFCSLALAAAATGTL